MIGVRQGFYLTSALACFKARKVKWLKSNSSQFRIIETYGKMYTFTFLRVLINKTSNQTSFYQLSNQKNTNFKLKIAITILIFLLAPGSARLYRLN